MQPIITPGNLKEIRPGVWRCQYRENGERRSVTVPERGEDPVHGKKEARQRVEAKKREKVEQQAKDAVWTVSKLGAAWLKVKLPELPSPMSKVQYRTQVEHYIGKWLGDRFVADLTQADIEGYRSDLLEKYHPRTVASTLVRLQQLLEWACDHDIVPRNVARKVKKPFIPDSPRRPFTKGEVVMLLKVLDSDLQKQCAIILGVLGLRRSEAVGLDLDDVMMDPPNKHPKGKPWVPLLHVQRQVQQNVRAVKGKPTTTEVYLPKTRLTRFVPVPDVFVPYLRRQKEWRESLETALSCFLISPTLNNYYTPDMASMVKEAAALAGIDATNLVFHSGRHTLATWGRQGGTPDVDIARVAGWKDTSMLVKLYGAHPDEARNALIAQEMGSYLEQEFKEVPQNVTQRAS